MNVRKILIFSLAYHPHVGGAEVAIKEITDRIEDIEFHLVTMRFSTADPVRETLGRVRVHRVGKGSGYLSKMLFVLRAATEGARLHEREHFDGAWVMMSYMLLPVMLMRLGGVRLPYALTLQEGDTESHMFGRLRILPFLPLLSSGFKQAKVVSAISTYLGGWARRRGFKGPLELVPNGVDVRAFSGEKVPHHGVVLVTSSRLVRKNAVDDIIRALPELPEVRLEILGSGPEEASLRALARSLQVEERVAFRGFIDNAALPEHLHTADIFIRPSRSEGMGISFVEAMAARLPVIATQEGGIADFLLDAKRNPGKAPTGWAVDKDAPAQIVAAVREIEGNPEEARRVVENAYEMVADKYDWSLIARAMREKVFARLFA